MRAPSQKQVKFVEGVREGKQPTEAAREAGYAESTIDKVSANITGSPLVQRLMGDIQKEHVTNGMNAKFISDNLKGLFESPQYKANVAAHQLWRKDMGLDKNEPPTTQQNVFIFSQEVALAAAEVLRKKL